MTGQLRRIVSCSARALRRFHRNERGDMLEYALVLAAFAIPLGVLIGLLMDVLSDFFAMIAFHIGWPFL